MMRTAIPLAAALAVCAGATAQVPVVRNARPIHAVPQPAGVAQTPSLPIPGSGGAPGVVRPTVLPRPYRAFGNFYDPWGYSPYWPIWYDTDPVPVAATNVVTVPVYVNVPQATVPAKPVDLRARLAMTVPSHSQVWLGGKEVDARVAPLVLESPPLQDGQSYTFDVKVAWPNGERTEERSRSVTIGAGDQKSLTYQR